MDCWLDFLTGRTEARIEQISASARNDRTWTCKKKDDSGGKAAFAGASHSELQLNLSLKTAAGACVRGRPSPCSHAHCCARMCCSCIV